jgi:hypothetical protein
LSDAGGEFPSFVLLLLLFLVFIACENPILSTYLIRRSKTNPVIFLFLIHPPLTLCWFLRNRLMSPSLIPKKQPKSDSPHLILRLPRRINI